MRDELKPDFLINAYAQGYFPMPEDEKILWFRPDPRAYFDIQIFKPSRSLKKSVRKFNFEFALDKDFVGVMKGCADRDDTWINEEFYEAYTELFNLGFAHSVEVYMADQLVGGLYGVQIGGLFCAETKFHRHKDASKAALWCLVEAMKYSGLEFLEVQFMTDHLRRLGAQEIADEPYQKLLRKIIFSKAKLKLPPTAPRQS